MSGDREERQPSDQPQQPEEQLHCGICQARFQSRWEYSAHTHVVLGLVTPMVPDAAPECRADRDGDCNWRDCPQIKDYNQAGCPLARWDLDEEGEWVCPVCQTTWYQGITKCDCSSPPSIPDSAKLSDDEILEATRRYSVDSRYQVWLVERDIADATAEHAVAYIRATEVAELQQQLATANEWCSAGQRMELKALRERDAALAQVAELVTAANEAIHDLGVYEYARHDSTCGGNLQRVIDAIAQHGGGEQHDKSK